jgi:hypothetical protein
MKNVADAAVALRSKRNELRAKHNLSFRDLYRSLELPGDHPLRTLTPISTRLCVQHTA